MRMDQVLETGPSDKPVGTRVHDAQTKNLSDYKPEGEVGDQSFALNLKGKTVWFSDIFRSQQERRSN